MGIVLVWFMNYFCIIKINNNLKNKYDYENYGLSSFGFFENR